MKGVIHKELRPSHVGQGQHNRIKKRSARELSESNVKESQWWREKTPHRASREPRDVNPLPMMNRDIKTKTCQTHANRGKRSASSAHHTHDEDTPRLTKRRQRGRTEKQNTVPVKDKDEEKPEKSQEIIGEKKGRLNEDEKEELREWQARMKEGNETLSQE